MVIPTPDELLGLMIEMLVETTGDTPAHWREVLGAIETFPFAASARASWDVNPKGNASDMLTVSHAIELVRARYPYVA